MRSYTTRPNEQITAEEKPTMPALRAVPARQVAVVTSSYGALRFKEALTRLDRATSWQERQIAADELVDAGIDSVGAAFEELSSPQPPERRDALLAVVTRWLPLSVVQDILRTVPARFSVLRASLTAALPTYYAGLAAGAQVDAARQLMRVILDLTKDADAAVRLEAVEALEDVGIVDLHIRGELRSIATGDSSPAVRRAASDVLQALD